LLKRRNFRHLSVVCFSRVFDYSDLKTYSDDNDDDDDDNSCATDTFFLNSLRNTAVTL
jgi:hypothetical protein